MNLTELKQRLIEFQITPKRSLGQNFLVSDTVIERILKQTKDFSPTQVVEIGPGIGALTEGLIKDFGTSLRLIELDQQLAEHWRNRGQDVTEADALKLNWTEFLPPLGGEGRAVLVSNLPYQISSTLVMELSSLEHPPFMAMILMFQKEVAERIVARPKTKDYGILSVVAQNTWKIKKVVDASARCFHPAPKISSRVLGFEIKKDFYASRSFLKFVKVGFQNRRKLLIKSLSALHTPEGWDWTQVVKDFGYDRNLRAEEVSPEQWKELHRIYLKALGKNEH